MRRRLMDTNDDTEQRGRELFEMENFVALKEFLVDLKAAPPQSNKFKTCERLQSGFVSQLRKHYMKAKRELNDPTRQDVSTLVQSMHTLTMAQPLEECIEGMGYGGWRLELQSDVKRVCNNLKTKSIALAEAWQLAAAEAAIRWTTSRMQVPERDQWVTLVSLMMRNALLNASLISSAESSASFGTSITPFSTRAAVVRSPSILIVAVSGGKSSRILAPNAIASIPAQTATLAVIGLAVQS